MEFKTEAQKACYERVAPMVRELFGEIAVVHPDRAGFGLRYGTAYVDVIVTPWRDNYAVLHARAVVVTGVEVTPELMQYLLEENTRFYFGAFGLIQNDIVLDYGIVGDTCDKEELRALMLTVVATAGDYDENIIARFGGKRPGD